MHVVFQNRSGMHDKDMKYKQLQGQRKANHKGENDCHNVRFITEISLVTGIEVLVKLLETSR